MDLVAGVPPLGWRVQRVGADTLHRVAAALRLESAFGRRATVAAVAVLQSTFSATTMELTCPLRQWGAAGEFWSLLRLLQLLLLMLWLLCPAPGRNILPPMSSSRLALRLGQC